MRSDSKPKYHITSTHNQGIKDDLRLKNRRFRDSKKLIALEGYGEFTHAYEAGINIERLYICPEYLTKEELPFLETVTRQTPIRIPPYLMEKLSYRQHPSAWFAVLRWSPLPLEQLSPVPGKQSLYIIAEDMEKPGNLGAILRSADAAGVQALIISSGRTDLRNPNVVRASRGALFSLPCVEAGNQQTLDWLRKHNIPIAIADPAKQGNLWNIDLPLPLACVLGAENGGLSSFWKMAAEIVISIPMLGMINSLNVAQAGTIIMYEILRRCRAR